MRNFSEFLTAYAVRYKGQGDFYEPWLLADKDGVWLKPLDAGAEEDFIPMEGELSDYIGFTEEEYKKEKSYGLMIKRKCYA